MDVGDDCNVAQALVGIYVGKIRHPPLIRMSNAIPSGFAAVSTARATGMGLRRSDRRAPQYFLDAKDFHQPSYQVAAYGPAFPQGSLPQLPAPVDVPPMASPDIVEPLCCICVFSFGVSRTTSPAAIAAIRRLQNARIGLVAAHDPAHPLDGIVVPVPVDKCDDYFSVRSSSAWAKKLRPT